ncbi:MAG: hypothetical protein H6755_06845 [Candidatus Omnitrophica bacterium]|nr:hypothetical protein [Candidatus Omnitrophota bacterium]
MLGQVTLLTSYLFAVIYPLCFWISFKEPLRDNFHRFHLGVANFVGGVCLVFILVGPYPNFIKIGTLVWKISFWSVSKYYWSREYPKVLPLTISSFLGSVAYIYLQKFLLDSNGQAITISILAGFIFCAALFAMNLGHWYLNVHGLKLGHLIRSVYLLWGFLLLRLLWNVYYIFTHNLIYDGDSITMLHFMMTMDGFLLFIGLFFGTLFPFIGLFFANGTLQLKNTQATTGILYVLLCSILIGDITYKYYLIKFGIPL